MAQKENPVWEAGNAPSFLSCRPSRLDGERQQAILRAAYELLGEAGYQGLRVDAVAARARASKATLYRHWPTKAGLVVDAIRFCKGAGEAMPDSGSLRGDLLALLGAMVARIDEAQREGWLGEAEGLKISLAGTKQKLAHLDEMDHRARTVHIGIPTFPEVAGRTVTTKDRLTRVGSCTHGGNDP